MSKYTLEYIRQNNLILFECIAGSRAYGTNIQSSDTDIRGVYISQKEDLMGLRQNYVEQVSDEKNDIIFYEIGRFFELALTNNPNILELLNMPDDCIVYKHPLFDSVRQELFLSKMCKNTFFGYAHEQIKKAKGLNKKIYNPVEVRRKNPIDFCYAFQGSESKPLTQFLQDAGYENKFCGVSSVPHARDVYALFYDMEAHLCFSESIEQPLRQSRIEENNKLGKSMGLGFKGVSFEDSNGIRMSSIPLGHPPVTQFYYNKDGYVLHCKDYKEYWDWVEKRNKQRFEVSEKASYDCKNMMHCVRLLNTAIDIAQKGKIIVRREEREYLLKIRNGEFAYEEVLEYAENLLSLVNVSFEESSLQEQPNKEEINQLLIEIRLNYYG